MPPRGGLCAAMQWALCHHTLGLWPPCSGLALPPTPAARGVLHQLHPGAACMLQQLQPVSCGCCACSLTPPVTHRAAWGCCASCTQTAAFVLQLLKPASCGCFAPSLFSTLRLWGCCPSYAAVAAAGCLLLLWYCSCTATNPCPVTNQGAMGVLQQLHSGCSFHVAAVANSVR